MAPGRDARPRGLKARLPVKPCATCGRPMAWRRAWARCWDEVRHCSDACRRARGRGRAGGAPAGGEEADG